jgi:molybdopterin-guanine dinucleotide biosynthesis protein A
LIQRLIRRLTPLYGRPVVVCRDPAPFQGLEADVITDRISGKGAPGGLHAALTASTTPWVFLMACDMPWVEPRLLELLARHREGMDAVVPLWDRRPQTLCALYSNRLQEPLEHALPGNPSFRDVLAGARTAWVPEEEVAMVSDGQAFQNINTPEDLARAGGHLPEP